jgi:hypothetical protein
MRTVQLVCALLLASLVPSSGLQIQFPKFFGSPPKSVSDVLRRGPSPAETRAVLEAVSYTNNGKDATPEQQATVLRLVRSLETKYPPNDRLLVDAKESEILNGVWYLQYTSSSVAGDADKFPDAWKPEVADEGNIGNKQFNAKGSICKCLTA